MPVKNGLPKTLKNKPSHFVEVYSLKNKLLTSSVQEIKNYRKNLETTKLSATLKTEFVWFIKLK